ncbi:non-hydrolyzing UDP-N-acetylglucosamine 2-epimerase [Duganella callida]|uniref:UDP-N-acetylglucosamine 2-epimerase (Non-hydrolyzing) n=1 Tax=Duganella callida TaxID=2561932 RepID=A0A4Y9S6U2_9BURK|nr:UDP-N-acetylglucosamine 2-epimerase (non-hydrolyzing) [Duganella callida]TFW17274.1 UDP-N-acetylglucosamine 2-epimerase (non-hydrolyzing) [Duganella callida]
MTQPVTAPPYRILCVVGARPNFMKMAPILAAFGKRPALHAQLVHTGQHYDVAMNEQYFASLGLPRPDLNLEVGSGSHAVQTAQVMLRFESALADLAPHAVLVVGDVNSTLACALVARKQGIPVIHVEAGLRSFDRAMPEEINRVLTDQLSDLLFTTEPDGAANLAREGVDARRVHFVGNVMIDTLRANLERAIAPRTIAADAGRAGFVDSAADGYALLTLHRPSNVDQPETLDRLLRTVGAISEQTPVMFPVHPRTLATIERFGLRDLIARPAILPLPPMGYLEMLGLMRDARVVLTDSGGIQEETTALGVPCITLRDNTERPITISEGTNVLAGNDPAAIMAAYQAVLRDGGKSGRIPAYWDGAASERIADILLAWLQRGCQPD